MKMNHQELSDGSPWLKGALRAYHSQNGRLKMSVEKQSADFGKRCRRAVLSALDVLKMSRYRHQLAAMPGPLVEHYQALAHLAGVNLKGVFATLGVKQAKRPDAVSARSMARLAQHLGLEEEEARLRLRFDFALTTRTHARGELAAVLQPTQARRASAGREILSAAKTVLRRCEAGYGRRRLAELRRAETVFAEVYDQ